MNKKSNSKITRDHQSSPNISEFEAIKVKADNNTTELACFTQTKISTFFFSDNDPRTNQWSAHDGLHFLLIQVTLDKPEFEFDAAECLIWLDSRLSVNPFGAVFMSSKNNPSLISTTFWVNGRFEPPVTPNQYGIAAVVPKDGIPKFLTIHNNIYRLASPGEKVNLMPQYKEMRVSDTATHPELVDADRLEALTGWTKYKLPPFKSGLFAKQKVDNKCYAAFLINHDIVEDTVVIDTDAITGLGQGGEIYEVKGLIIWIGPNLPDNQGPHSFSGQLGIDSFGLNILYADLSFAPRESFEGPYTCIGIHSSKLVVEFDSAAFDNIVDINLGSGFTITDED